MIEYLYFRGILVNINNIFNVKDLFLYTLDYLNYDELDNIPIVQKIWKEHFYTFCIESRVSRKGARRFVHVTIKKKDCDVEKIHAFMRQKILGFPGSPEFLCTVRDPQSKTLIEYKIHSKFNSETIECEITVLNNLNIPSEIKPVFQKTRPAY